jgi:RimJ/RimL family protein N-acetyltransferase
MEPFVLEGAGLRLDQVADADIAAIAKYCQEPVFEQYMTLPWPYTLGDAQYFVDEHVPRGWRDGNEFTWAIRHGVGEELLGVIGFRTANSDLGFWLGSPHRGRGIMTAAVRLVTTALFAMGITAEIAWECVVGNTASLAVARKCGFTFTSAGPAHLEARDGTHPQSWHALLRVDDPPTQKSGWPDPATVNRRGQENPALSVMLFDLDDTLFAHRAAVDAGILQYRAQLGGPYSEGDNHAVVQRWYQLEETQYHRYLAGMRANT